MLLKMISKTLLKTLEEVIEEASKDTTKGVKANEVQDDMKEGSRLVEERKDVKGRIGW